MTEKQNLSLPQEEEFAEIEFSSEQLLSLTKARSATPVAAERGPDRWRTVALATGAVSVIALSAIIGYERVCSAPDVAPPPPRVTAIETPTPPPPMTAQVVEPLPVRVRNPFDRSEVFEFPPGTTPQQAQAAVADTLLERARERQAEYDAKHSKRRRARPG